jgi:endonuclease/exonuclease/phosphatase family metal-dependent hydrolase
VDVFAGVFNSSPAEKGAWSGKADIDGDDWSNRQESPELPESAIVCGDFNASPDTDEYSLLLESTGLIDCWSLADPGNQNSSSLRKETSQDIRVAGKVDHILVTPDMIDSVNQVSIDDDAAGSDHKPVWAILNLTG